MLPTRKKGICLKIKQQSWNKECYNTTFFQRDHWHSFSSTFQEQELRFINCGQKKKKKKKKKKGKKERMQSTRPRSRHVTAIQGNYFKRDEISRILEGIRLLWGKSWGIPGTRVPLHGTWIREGTPYCGHSFRRE